MSSSRPATGLADRIATVIARGAGAPLADEEFDALALAVFAHQFEFNRVYRRYCEARGASPDNVNAWLDIPAVPTDAFKAADLVCGDSEEAQVTFRTSGTTQGDANRGRHFLLDTSFYQRALSAGFRRHMLPQGEPMPILSLVAPWEAAPDSSLSFMISEVARAFGTQGSGFFADSQGLTAESLLTRLQELCLSSEPVLLAGTSLAFVHLLETMAERGVRLTLPHGSRIMDTGGFKGLSRQVSRDDLYRMMTTHFGVAVPWIVNEYGMTEMSSQFYDGIAGSARELGERRYTAPGWVRSVAVDPETLAVLGEGSLGILRHLDLANLDSVAALQTADLGRVSGGEIELRGRASGAEARGCSIAMDELVMAARRA